MEQQRRMRSSLLNWMRWVLRVRAAHCDVFGRGEVAFLPTGNGRMLAYRRTLGRRTILCVANLSETAQATRSTFPPGRGASRSTCSAAAAFPLIGREPYPAQLTGHGFYWLELVPAGQAHAWRDPSSAAAHRPELPVADPQRP